jgi:hypothetical protein
MCTTFWHQDGTPMSAQQFLELLFGELPEFFKDEAELRALWSVPDTRKMLLNGLAEKGFGHEQLAEMQKIIDAEKSDLFDVLAYVAYALPLLTREERSWRLRFAALLCWPTGKQHGLENPNGHHAGDMPNFTVKQNGSAKATVKDLTLLSAQGANRIRCWPTMARPS